jgi:hypothetical protein
MRATHASTRHGLCIIQVTLRYCAVAKILLSPLRWEGRVVLFLTVRRVFTKDAQLSYGGFFFVLSFLSHFLEKHT